MATEQTPKQIAENDEFFILYNESKIWAPRKVRFEALRDSILSRHPNLAADKIAVVAGTNCEIQIGQRTNVYSWISMAAVSKAVGGWKAFQQICTVSFKDLSESPLGIVASKALQTKTQTGYRKLTAVATMSVPCERVLPVELPIAA